MDIESLTPTAAFPDLYASAQLQCRLVTLHAQASKDLQRASWCAGAKVDVLTSVFRELDFAAAGYRRFELIAPWAVLFDQEGLRGIHVVAEGRCEIVFGNDDPQLLDTGDLVIAPRAERHVLRSRDASNLVPTPSTQLEAKRDGGPIGQVGSGERTVIICGAFVFNDREHPALQGLPRMVRVAGSDGRASRWLNGYVETIMTEALEPGAGSEVVLGRLSSALVVRALRHGLEDVEEAGWLKAMRDPGIARALAAIHDRCAERWTVALLASEARQSRAAFAERFHALVGEPPMRYILRRRMREAARLLTKGQAGLAQIADAVGYGSEAALSAAFKRHYGLSPGAYRQIKATQ